MVAAGDGDSTHTNSADESNEIHKRRTPPPHKPPDDNVYLSPPLTHLNRRAFDGKIWVQVHYLQF
jgi:hypothetical protein